MYYMHFRISKMFLPVLLTCPKLDMYHVCIQFEDGLHYPPKNGFTFRAYQ